MHYFEFWRYLFNLDKFNFLLFAQVFLVILYDFSSDNEDKQFLNQLAQAVKLSQSLHADAAKLLLFPLYLEALLEV